MALASVGRRLLHKWKRDQKWLLERFDTNRDGVLSADEWDRARTAAHEQVVADSRFQPVSPGIRVLSKPADGRPFLLAGTDARSLERRLRYRALAGIIGFVGSSSALAWLLT